MPARDLIEVSATGDVTTQVPAILHSVTMTADSAAGTLVVKDGSGGSARLTMQTPTNSTRTHTFGAGVQFSTSVHATITGAGVVASFEVS